MDFNKLKLDSFKTYQSFNAPSHFSPPLEQSNHPETYFLFVTSVEDVLQAINLVQNHQTHKENRAFFVFEKGNKSFGRDHVYNLIMRHGGFIRKAPVLSSLSKEYSVFSFMLKV